MTIFHTEECWSMPRCTVCGLIKPPYGRDPGVMMSGGMCGPDCSGYMEEPKAGHFWRDEEPELLEQMRKEEVTNDTN